MDVMLQSHEAKRVFPVPEGLRELASDITREVLRSQPTNIYEFIADYCEALLSTRDSAIAAAEMVDDMLEHDATFEALLEKKGVSMAQAQQASIIIQAAFRGYYTRQMLRVKDIIEDPILRKLGIDKKLAELATTTIQAAFRGYITRKNLHATSSMPTSRAVGDQVDHSEIILRILEKSGLTWEEVNVAATSIQRAFREYSVKQSLKDRPPGEPQEEGRRRRTEGSTTDTKSSDDLKEGTEAATAVSVTASEVTEIDETELEDSEAVSDYPHDSTIESEMKDESGDVSEYDKEEVEQKREGEDAELRQEEEGGEQRSDEEDAEQRQEEEGGEQRSDEEDAEQTKEEEESKIEKENIETETESVTDAKTSEFDEQTEEGNVTDSLKETEEPSEEKEDSPLTKSSFPDKDPENDQLDE